MMHYDDCVHELAENITIYGDGSAEKNIVEMIKLHAARHLSTTTWYKTIPSARRKDIVIMLNFFRFLTEEEKMRDLRCTHIGKFTATLDNETLSFAVHF